MPREVEPQRPAVRAPRGCLVAFVLAVLLLAACVVAVALALRPTQGM